jgi:hypothetical protein
MLDDDNKPVWSTRAIGALSGVRDVSMLDDDDRSLFGQLEL